MRTAQVTLEIHMNFTDEEIRKIIVDAMNDCGAGLRLYNGENACEGCAHCRYPGVRWPASPDSNSDRSWVERCDWCLRFESDLDAALYIARDMDAKIGIGYVYMAADTPIGADFEQAYLEPIAVNREKLTKIYSEAPNGVSLFLDRPERDKVEV